MRVWQKWSHWLLGCLQRYRGSMTPATKIAPVPRPQNLDGYEGMWVAVANGEVIAVGETSDELALRLQAADIRKSREAVVEYVRPGSDAYIVGVG